MISHINMKFPLVGLIKVSYLLTYLLISVAFYFVFSECRSSVNVMYLCEHGMENVQTPLCVTLTLLNKRQKMFLFRSKN